MSPRTKILAAAVAVIAVVGGYWHFALAPQRAKAAVLAKQVTDKQQVLSSAQATLATYTADQKAYPANYATLLRLGKAVPEDDDVQSLLVQLDAAAHRTGVDFRTLKVSSQSGAGADSAPTTAGAAAAAATPPGAVSVGSAGFSAMPFTFSFRGGFAGLTKFLAQLHRFVSEHNDRMRVTGRLLRIDSVVLKPDATGFPRLRADVSASSFLLPATEGLTAGGSASGPAATPAASGAGATGTTPAGTSTAIVEGATTR